MNPDSFSVCRDSSFDRGWLNTGPHKLSGLDEPNTSLTTYLVRTIVLGEELHPIRGDPISAKHHGSRPKGQ